MYVEPDINAVSAILHVLFIFYCKGDFFCDPVSKKWSNFYAKCSLFFFFSPSLVWPVLNVLLTEPLKYPQKIDCPILRRTVHTYWYKTMCHSSRDTDMFLWQLKRNYLVCPNPFAMAKRIIHVYLCNLLLLVHTYYTPIQLRKCVTNGQEQVGC